LASSFLENAIHNFLIYCHLASLFIALQKYGLTNSLSICRRRHYAHTLSIRQVGPLPPINGVCDAAMFFFFCPVAVAVAAADAPLGKKHLSQAKARQVRCLVLSNTTPTNTRVQSGVYFIFFTLPFFFHYVLVCLLLEAKGRQQKSALMVKVRPLLRCWP